MAVFRWPGGLDPFSSMRTLQREMERVMGRSFFGESQRVGGGNYPAVNIFDGRDDVVVQCELAGVKREEIDLTLTGETLSIRGTKRLPEGEEQLEYQRRERGVGDFNRTIVLPDRVEAERIEATLQAGVLTIRLPKAETAKPRQIKIQ